MLPKVCSELTGVQGTYKHRALMPTTIFFSFFDKNVRNFQKSRCEKNVSENL